tara:strand:- start:3900 stop:5315 length:1416 start_codon:yes stop_codon:yes gene_type:complete
MKGKLLYDPYGFQVNLVETYHNNRFNINLLPRQTGKTTTAAGYLLWHAMFVPDSTILIAAHKYAGAAEIMQRVRYAYELCPDYIRAGVSTYNKGSIEFENGSRIVAQATTENTGRGMSITLLYCDEFAFVRDTIATEFWTSISPTLATGGKCIITSTPNSDEDQFWILWKEANMCFDSYGNETELGKNGFKAFTAKWWEHPDRDEQWKQDEIGRIGIDRFRREHECEPIIWEETLIAASKLIDLQGIEPIEKHGQVRWFKKPTKDHIYMVALDPAIGTGGDNAAIQIFELPGMIQVGEWYHNKTDIVTQIGLIAKITAYIAEEIVDETGIYYTVENNSVGEAALVSINEIGEENIKGTFLSEPKKIGKSRMFRKGFNTTAKSKIATCAKLKMLVETKRAVINSKSLISELKTFVALGNSYEAKPGGTDDLVDAFMLSVRMAQALQQYIPEIEQTLKDNLEQYDAPMPIVIM